LRIAVMSDTHSNGVAFKAVISDMKSQSPDILFFLGDVAMRGPQPSECLELLHSLDFAQIVRGNYGHIFTRFPRNSYKH
jgi:predicted phosphodiesterase